mgnify:CR=1 FL=1
MPHFFGSAVAFLVVYCSFAKGSRQFGRDLAGWVGLGCLGYLDSLDFLESLESIENPENPPRPKNRPSLLKKTPPADTRQGRQIMKSICLEFHCAEVAIY